jgi:hypothetical protein
MRFFALALTITAIGPLEGCQGSTTDAQTEAPGGDKQDQALPFTQFELSHADTTAGRVTTGCRLRLTSATCEADVHIWVDAASDGDVAAELVKLAPGTKMALAIITVDDGSQQRWGAMLWAFSDAEGKSWRTEIGDFQGNRVGDNLVLENKSTNVTYTLELTAAHDTPPSYFSDAAARPITINVQGL